MDVEKALAIMEDYGADTQTAEHVAACVIVHFGPCSPEAKRVCDYMEDTEASRCGLIYLAMRGEMPDDLAYAGPNFRNCMPGWC